MDVRSSMSWHQTLESFEGEYLSSSEIAIHIRLGDALDGVHRDYFPLPLDFYQKICEESGCNPVFVGELESGGDYMQQLKKRFPDARYLSGSLRSDWDTVRFAPRKVLSISSFSWFAAWLGAPNTEIHMPLAGILNPIQRPEIDLLPVGDQRYRMYWMHPVGRKPTKPLRDHLNAVSVLSSGYPRWL